METNDETRDPLVEDQEQAAAAEAAAIGGDPGPGSDHPDPAMRPVEDSGGGVAEGFEQAESDLIENATHGDGAGNPEANVIDNEHVDAERSTAEYGEPDELDTPDD